MSETRKSSASISVVIGVTDEVHSLQTNLDALFQACAPSEIAEIILVSHDRTTDEMREMIRQYASCCGGYVIKTYQQKQNGFGYFLIETLPLLQGEYAVYCSADNATDLRIIHVFSEIIHEYPNVVVFASRWCSGGGFHGYGVLKTQLNYLFQRFIALLYHTSLSDFSFAYQCVPVKMYRGMKLERRDMSVFLESRLKIVKNGYSIIEVPAFWMNRSEGKTRLRIGRLMSYLYVAFKVKWSKDIESV